MVFQYKGKKDSSRYTVISGFLILITVGSLVVFFSLLEDVSDLNEYIVELFFILFFSGSVFYHFFKKKSKKFEGHIIIKGNKMLVDGLKISFSDIQLDIYKSNKNIRYHIWDVKNRFSMYSVFEDDLYNYLKSTSIPQHTFSETSYKKISENVMVISKNRNLYYNLETGSYKIIEGKSIIKNVTPTIFTYDGKFRLTHTG